MASRPGDKPFSTGVAGGRSLVRRERFRGRVTVDVKGLKEVLKYTEKLGDVLVVNLARRITIASVIVQRAIQRNITKRFVQRTGKFRKSWQLRLITKRKGGAGQLAGGSVVGIVGSDHPAAFIQDVGGVINAKGKPMPVPLTDEAKMRKAAGMPQSLVTTATGFLVDASRTPPIFHFVLARSVSLQGTNYLHEALQIAEPQIFEHVGEGIRLAVEGRRVT